MTRRRSELGAFGALFGRARELAEGLDTLERLGDALELARHQVAKDRRDVAEGVIEMREIAPGVFAAPPPQRRRPMRGQNIGGQVGRFTRALAELEQQGSELAGHFDTLRGIAWQRRR